MKIRRRGLPEGWFPGTERDIRRFLGFSEPFQGAEGAVAGIVPHAGWTFCGSMIAEVIRSLPEKTDTLVILGGHNPPGMPIIRYSEDAWDTPPGRIYRDTDFAAEVEARLPGDTVFADEESVDNTVEVVIPLVAVLHPRANWAAWRLPADLRAVEFGAALAESAAATGKHIAVVGSTDLTHYGPNYGFAPAESSGNPAGWTRERDMKILKAIADFDYRSVLELASAEKSACSAGAAVGAMAFAENTGAKTGRLLKYATSGDVYPSSSFVGYGALIWESA